MKYLTIILAVASLTMLTSCINYFKAEGPIETRGFNVADFEGIDLDGSGDVFVYYGEEFDVEVTTHDDLFKSLDIYVSKGILYLDFKPEYHSVSYDKLQYKITLPELHYLSLDGSGEINVMDNFEVNRDFAMKIDGSGDILTMDITADRIFADINGSGTITTEDIDCQIFNADMDGSGKIRTQGYARKQNIDLNGSGDIITDYLETFETYVDVDGSGDCKVWVTDYLTVRIDGSGTVYYYGDPLVNSTINGSGNMVHLYD